MIEKWVGWFLARERYGHLIGADLGASFTDLIGVARSARVASGIDVGAVIRRFCDERTIPVNINLVRSRAAPGQADRVYSAYLVPRGAQRDWRSGFGAVPPAGVKIVLGALSAPDDHFAASPDCRVIVSARGCVGGAGGCPTVGAGIISPAVVKKTAAIKSTPDDHFTTGPHCCVMDSDRGRVGGAGRCPGIIRAAGRVARYHRKRIVSRRRGHYLRLQYSGFNVRGVQAHNQTFRQR